MFRFIILFAAILLTSAKLYSQPTKRANVWYFGYNAGLDFNSGKPVGLRDGALYQREGCSSIADDKGNLVLYTDGTRIWNKKHMLISGDTELGGDDTSTQSALIVPMPGNPNIYYVFSTFTKLVCVTIDISLDKGKGGVVSRNVLLENSTEKLAAVQHCNQRDFWILGHEKGNRVFRSFLLTDQGITKSSIVSKIGTPLDFYKSVGNMKFSQQGDKLAMAIFEKSQFELFEFDNSSGILSKGISIKHKDFFSAYGLEFSPNGNFLYVSATVNVGRPIFQLDISVMNTKKIIESKSEIGRPSESYFGSMQLGPDGKIYVARTGLKHLGVINNPDGKGTKCAYVDNGFELPAGVSSMGMPNYAVSIPKIDPDVTIQRDNKCNNILLTAESTIRFSRYAFQWYNGKQEIQGANAKTYKPTRSGEYSVVLTSECLDKKIRSVPIRIKLLEVSASYSTLECGLLELSVQANGPTVWRGKGLSDENKGLRKVRVSGSGKDAYYVRVLDELDPSCYIEMKLDVNFGVCDASVFVPDIFTPNGDHINDSFEILIADGEGVELRIYDRWGKVVHYSKKPEMQWDGKIEGKDALTGTYNYVVQYKNNLGHEFVRRGTVILRR